MRLHAADCMTNGEHTGPCIPGKQPDPINNPSHYCVNGMECIDVIEALGLGYRLGSAFAYIWRAGRKASAVEDLKKARWFLDREIAKLEDKGK